MGKYPKRAFQLGTSWLAQRTGSAAWYRCWREGNGTQRVSLGTANFEEAKQRLTDWFVLQSQPAQESAQVTIAEVIARYWNERGQFTSHPPTVNTHCNYWLDHFGERSVEDALAYAEQERFKTALLGGGLSPQTVNHVISTGRAALRMAWKKGELKSVPPVSMLPVGDQQPMGRPVSLEEAARLLAELRGHVWLLNVILIGTLARPSAIFQLDWSQVDFETGLIFLNPPGRTQTKKRRPVVKMPPFLQAVLWARRGEGPVVAFEGKPVKSVRTAWRQARKRAGLDPSVTLYSWRHTLSRWMRSRGVDKWEVQGQLGHRGGVTERYAEFAPDYQVKATAAIETFWNKIVGDSSGTVPRTMSAKYLISWCRLRGLNSRPSVYKTAALPLS